MSQNIKPENVNNSFFDGYYKDIWRQFFPEKTTRAEVDFIIEEAKLNPGSYVLDLMCGYGRHALEFASRKINVTAVDNLADYIDEIKKTVDDENLSVDAVKCGVVDFTTDKEFDLVLCMGNSINFFNASDTSRILKNISSLLKPGGHLLINSWSLAEIAIRSFKETSNSMMGGMEISNESQYFFHPSRIKTISTITDSNGNKEIKKGIDYLFTVNEMESMLNEAGLKMEEVYSIPGKKKFTLGEPRAYIVAVK